MKSRIIATAVFALLSTAEIIAQSARNIPRDSGPVQWTFGNVIVFIVFPVLLIVFLFFYVRKLTSDKIAEKEKREAEEAEKP